MNKQRKAYPPLSKEMLYGDQTLLCKILIEFSQRDYVTVTIQRTYLDNMLDSADWMMTSKLNWQLPSVRPLKSDVDR